MDIEDSLTYSKAKIAHMTSVHTAQDTRIFQKECVTLARSGFEVSLIAPGDRIQVIDGVKIVPLSPQKCRLRRMLFTSFKMLLAAIRAKADIYHFHDPELFPVGIALRAFGKKVIYDAHEDLPLQVLNKPWIPNSLRPTISTACQALEWIGGKMLTGVVTATHPIAKKFPKEKTVVVRNFPDTTFWSHTNATPYDTREHNVTFMGALSKTRGVFDMIEAIDKVPSRYQVKLLLAGKPNNQDLLTTMAGLPGWVKTKYLGEITPKEVRSHLFNTKIGLALYHAVPAYLDAIPVKLLEFMSAGVPVVASDIPGTREIIEIGNCGILVPPEDPDAVAAAVTKLLADPTWAKALGESGKTAVQKTLNWQNEANTLINFYLRVLQRHETRS